MEPPGSLTPGWANLPLPLSSAPEVVIAILPGQRRYHVLHMTNYNTSVPVCTRTPAHTTGWGELEPGAIHELRFSGCRGRHPPHADQPRGHADASLLARRLAQPD